MTRNEFEQYLLRLKLTAAEAAQLLSVSARTVRRWLEGEEIPGLAQTAIRAFIRLHERHLPWRPDHASIVRDDQDQIALHRSHVVELDQVLALVEARGGAKAPWSVDWENGRASLETMEVSFYKLPSGNFSLGPYRRTDRHPDSARDAEMIQDAAYCISKALEKKSPDYGPVMLVVHDGPAKGRIAKERLEQFPTARAAVKYVCEYNSAADFHEPFIITRDGELVWDRHELQRECIRRANAPRALAALAKYVRDNPSSFVQDGPHSFAPVERLQRENHIKALADEIDQLAEQAKDGSIQYQQFEEALGALHAAGFFPLGSLVSNVAYALEGVKQ